MKGWWIVTNYMLLGIATDKGVKSKPIEEGRATGFVLGGTWWTSRTLGQEGTYLKESFRTEVFDSKLYIYFCV